MQITAILTPDDSVKTTASTSQTQTTDDFSTYMNQNTSDDSLTSIFQKASETYDVPMSLLTAMAKQESNFQTDATSTAGAMGIMQLMPATATELGCTDAYDPEQNIMAGAKYISQLLQKYNGNVSLALAAYNAGSNNVDKYGGIPPFEETQNYVAKITSYMNEGVTLPDGSSVSGSSDNSSAESSGLTSSILNQLDADSLKQILNKIFSYDDYLGLLNQLAESIQDAATDSTATETDSSDSINSASDSSSLSSADSTTGNSTFAVTVTGSNPSSESDSSNQDTEADSDLYYAYQSINYNNSVLNLLSQNSGSNA